MIVSILKYSETDHFTLSPPWAFWFTLSLLIWIIALTSSLSFCSFLPTDDSQYSSKGSLNMSDHVISLPKTSRWLPVLQQKGRFLQWPIGPTWSVFLFITFLTLSPTIPSLIQFMTCCLLNTLDKFPPEVGAFFSFSLEYFPTAQTFKCLFYLFQFNFILFQICSYWQLFGNLI